MFPWVHSGTPWCWRLHSGSRGLITVRLGVVGIIRGCVGSFRRIKWSSGSFGFVCFHLCATKRLRVHSGWRAFTRSLLKVAGFTRVLVGLLASDKGASGLFGFEWVHLCVPKCRCVLTGSLTVVPRDRRVHSGSRGFTRACLEVVGIIRVLVGTLGRVMGSSGSIGFARMNLGAPTGRRVHCGFAGSGIAVVGFIRFRVGSIGRTKGSLDLFGFAWGHSGAPRGLLGSRGFTPAHHVVVVFILIRLCSLGPA